MKREIYKDRQNQVALGIFVENRSKFDLKKPILNIMDCSATRMLVSPKITPSCTKSMIILDNESYKDYGICGSISWQIFYRNGERYPKEDGKGRRFITTYRVPYRLVLLSFH